MRESIVTYTNSTAAAGNVLYHGTTTNNKDNDDDDHHDKITNRAFQITKTIHNDDGSSAENVDGDQRGYAEDLATSRAGKVNEDSTRARVIISKDADDNYDVKSNKDKNGSAPPALIYQERATSSMLTSFSKSYNDGTCSRIERLEEKIEKFATPKKS